MIFRYIVSVIVALTAWVTSFFVVPILALFLDKGNLRYGRKWYQPPDNLAIGDVSWKNEHPTYSDYRLAVSYCLRNPTQGVDQALKAEVYHPSICKTYGDIDNNDHRGLSVIGLITCTGVGGKKYFYLNYTYKEGGECFGRQIGLYDMDCVQTVNMNGVEMIKRFKIAIALALATVGEWVSVIQHTMGF